MKSTSHRSYGLLATIIFILLTSCLGKKEMDVVVADYTYFYSPRESITFILGDDLTDNEYYTEATKYYLYNDIDRTEYTVSTCRSLKEVLDYLGYNKPSNNQPWGTINLVTHGNQWLGLSVRILPGKYRSTVANLEMVLAKELTTPLSDDIIDSLSEINIHGCGIGNNEKLLENIGEFFSSNSHRPLVRASLLFENYSSNAYDQNSLISSRYFAEAYFAYYKKGYRQGDIRLSHQLSNRYSDADVNWRDMLTRTRPRWQGDSFHYTFNVPVKWIVLYENDDSLPDISTDEKKQHWLLQQKELMSVIESTDIPTNKFSWSIKRIKYKLENGQLAPAIRAKGLTTVLCVLVPMVDNDRNVMVNQPFIPSLNDDNYYTIVMGSKVK